jgi:trehalose 6-phosphate phosphatase
MPELMEDEVCELKMQHEQTQEEFLQSVATASKSALLLDFDGTLAPFRVDRFKAKPWAGVVDLIEAIRDSGRTHLALITGRPAAEAATQLGMKQPPEIWGLHGVERLLSGGVIKKDTLLDSEETALAGAKAAIHEAKLGLLIEDKWNAVVIHWRAKELRTMVAAHAAAAHILGKYKTGERMTLLEFDGGVELRAGRNKGDAVREIVAEMQPGTPVAYLGDDATDEDAFLELQGSGMGILVRKQWRPSAASLLLRPPDELRAFLRAWLRAVR